MIHSIPWMLLGRDTDPKVPTSSKWDQQFVLSALLRLSKSENYAGTETSELMVMQKGWFGGGVVWLVFFIVSFSTLRQYILICGFSHP